MKPSRIFLLAVVFSSPILPAGAIWKDFDEATLIIGRQTLPSPTSLFSPFDVAVNPASGKVFVADYGNNRVLRFSSAAALANGGAAEAAFGQPDLYSGDAGVGADRCHGPLSAAVDGAGHLWVSDVENNRVLRWDNADTAPSGSAAVQVLGQVNFTNRSAGRSQTMISRPGGLAIDSAGRLWVADYFNNRVLRFDNPTAKGNGGAADGLLGQADYTAAAVGLTATNFDSPYDLDVDAQGRLWVADFGNTRVLRFDTPSSQIQPPADGVLGQENFTSELVAGGKDQLRSAIHVEASPGGSVFVLDAQNGRILRWDNAAAKANGADADGALGRTGLEENSGYASLGGSVNGECRGMASDAAGHLWMVDRVYERVLRWDNVNAKANGANADGVIGQPTITTTPASTIHPALVPAGPRNGLEDPLSGKFFIVDSGRVLRYTSRFACENGAAPEAALGKYFLADYGGGSASDVNLRSAWGIALDSAGRLWVSDPEANRVVAFANATTAATATPMAVVLGQTGLFDNGPGLAQNRLDQPRGLCIDAAGNLYVADYGNHRVLRFADIATRVSGDAATAVIGQQDFITASTLAGTSLLKNPSSVCLDAQGRLWVADTGKSRVTRYDTPLVSAPLDAPSGILGGSGGLSASTMGQPHAVAVDAAGRLFVLDYFFNRILRFENAAAKANNANADGILCQPTFTNYVLDGRTLRTPRRSYGMFLDAAQNLWLGDEGNARLMRFSPKASAYITQLNPTLTQYSFTFHGEAGIPYTVKSSTDLKNWQTEESFNLGAPGLQVFTKNKDGRKRFYRIEEP